MPHIFRHAKSTVAGNFLLALLGVIFSILAAEVILRFMNVVRDVGPSFSQYDPVYGKRLRKNFETVRTTPEFEIHYAINSYGFRGPEPSTFPLYPVLFIGDSFTEGYGVSDGEEFPALIRKELAKAAKNAVPVVNAGIGNSGNGHWIKLLRREAGRYKPRLVVLQFCSNDFADNVRENLFRISPAGELVELTVPPSGAREKLKVISEAIPGLVNSHVAGFAYQVFYHFQQGGQTTKASANSDMEDQLFFHLTEEALLIAKEQGWPVVAVITEIKGKRLEKLTGLLKRYGTPYLDIPYKSDRPELYYKVDGHWNADGHKYVAQSILPSVISAVGQGGQISDK